jgi:hypothetical protein
MVVQEFHQHDWAKQVDFARNMLEIVADDAATGTSDKAHFHLSGCVNKQNFCYWLNVNPQQLHVALFTLNVRQPGTVRSFDVIGL